jgi:hypothetical protein
MSDLSLSARFADKSCRLSIISPLARRSFEAAKIGKQTKRRARFSATFCLNLPVSSQREG